MNYEAKLRAKINTIQEPNTQAFYDAITMLLYLDRVARHDQPARNPKP